MKDRPSTRVWRARFGDHDVYIKYMTARNDSAAMTGRGWNAWRWRCGSSRAMHVMRISAAMRDSGLLTPEVLLAARRTTGEGTHEVLITRTARERPLSDFLRWLPEGDSVKRILQVAGRRIAALHRRRFIHGDLLPGNLLLTDDGDDLIFLDNDRTWRWPFAAPRKPRERNLMQILYRTMGFRTWRESRSLLDAYLDACQLTGRRRRGVRDRIVRRLRERLVHEYSDRRDVLRSRIAQRDAQRLSESALP